MLMNHIENFVFRRAAQQGIRHLSRPDLDSTDPTLRAVYGQLATEFQTAPPVTLHASDPELLAGYWHASREVYVVNRGGRAMREAVAAEISQLNSCPYCETVHAGMFAAAGGREMQGDGLRAARTWAQATLSPGSDPLARPGFSPENIPQIFATAVVFHYTNRMVSLFLEEAPVPLPGMASRMGRALTEKTMALMARRIATHHASPGAAAVQRRADLPEAFAWAKGAPHVAAGLAHFAQAAEEAGRESVPAPVRALVHEYLSAWTGGAPPLSRSWLEPFVEPLALDERPIARLALLTASAPWQVDDNVIADFRKAAPTDRALVQTAGWSAFATATRVGSWFPVTGDNADMGCVA